MSTPRIIKMSNDGMYRVIYSEYYNSFKVQQKSGCWRQIAEYKREYAAVRYFNRITNR